MPHSSGGGCHGGGSHGGGFGGRGGGGSYSCRTSHHHFNGCRVFYYYRKKRPVFVYADGDIKKYPKDKASYIISLIIISLFIFIGIYYSTKLFVPIRPLQNTEQYEIEINDNINCLGNTAELKNTLQEFKSKTGITVDVTTVYNETWRTRFMDLESYSYDLYLDKFNDETHWLIVYSTQTTINPEFERWYFEGMQGDDTDSVLMGDKTRKFTKSLQKYLTERDNYTITEAIDKAFTELNDCVMDFNFIEAIKYDDNYNTIFTIAVGFTLLPGLGVWICIAELKKISLYAEAKEIIDGNAANPTTSTCAYCGGVYVDNVHSSCPHCGAAIRK